MLDRSVHMMSTRSATAQALFGRNVSSKSGARASLVSQASSNLWVHATLLKGRVIECLPLPQQLASQWAERQAMRRSRPCVPCLASTCMPSVGMFMGLAIRKCMRLQPF